VLHSGEPSRQTGGLPPVFEGLDIPQGRADAGLGGVLYSLPRREQVPVQLPHEPGALRGLPLFQNPALVFDP
jgi:hypothetical protein